MRTLLIGAGHAHLCVVRQASRLRAAGVDACLISPPRFRYSGLATGVLSGAVEPETGEIDVARLADAFGVEFLPTEVTAIDRDSRQVKLGDGTALAFDALSMNTGSMTADPRGVGAANDVWAVKPLSRLLDLRSRIDEAIARTGRCPSLVVAGTGQAGFEVAAALAGLCERRRVSPDVALVGPLSGQDWAPEAAIRALLGRFVDRGVRVVNDTVASRGEGICELASGKTVACDALVLATGLKAPDLLQGLGLAVDADGRLLTDATLQSMDDMRIFGVGDCAVVATDRRPCVGVFGVRAAPVLADNLGALAQGRKLRPYRPQATWLSIMDLGDGTGLALKGDAWWLGRAPLHLKRRLDLGFMTRMRAPPASVRRRL